MLVKEAIICAGPPSRQTKDHMIEAVIHSWRESQEHGACLVVEKDSESVQRLRTVAGLDLHWHSTGEGIATAAVVTLDDLSAPAQYYSSKHQTSVPYAPGFLGFREVDAYRKLAEQVLEARRVDCFLIDGNGRLHPRKYGSACHFGVTASLCTIGVAKSLHRICENLTERSVKDHMNANKLLEMDLFDAQGALVGKAVRKSLNSQTPVYVSVGHRISLQSASAIVRSLLRFNMPEPLRLADMHARSLSKRGAI